MYIKKLHLTNFKSFKNLDIDFNNLNVIIGANASGKSNFVNIFKFIKEIESDGLEDAVSMMGGKEYLLNAQIGTKQPLSISLTANSNQTSFFERNLKGEKKQFIVKGEDFTYDLEIKFNEEADSFTIRKDSIKLKCKVYEKRKEKEIEVGAGTISVAIKKGILQRNYKFKLTTDIKLREKDLFFLTIPDEFSKRPLPSGLLLLGSPFFYPLSPLGGRLIPDINIYNFDPSTCKIVIPFTGRAKLEENGKNLAVVLKDILKNGKRKKKFFNLISDLLPFVKEMDVEKFADRVLNLKLVEIYNKKFHLPASLMSDGTMSISALIVALYFQSSSLVIIEEPERNLHPYLIFKLMGMIKEVSKNKQIIITTHSPEVVKDIDDMNNLLLISRNKDGQSIITKPSEIEEVKEFLKNDIGIDELYKKNLLLQTNDL